jgi:hypothetical protein
MPARLDLRTIGGWAAIVGTVLFIAGVAVIAATGGPETVIPETGDGLRTWVRDVAADRDGFVAGAAVLVAAGLLFIPALTGFWDALRSDGPAPLIAAILGIVGITLVTLSHALPIVLAYELVPGFGQGGPALQTTGDLFAGTALAANLTGDLLLWGVSVPLLALAVLRTRQIPRWLGWLGLFVGVVGGWVGALGYLVQAADDISTLGFLGFFVWMIAMGMATIRLARSDPLAATPPGAVPRPPAAPARARRGRRRAGARGRTPLR